MDSSSDQPNMQTSRLTSDQIEMLDRLAELTKVLPVGELLATERAKEHLARLEAMLLYPHQWLLTEPELEAIRAATDAYRTQLLTQAIRKPR
jgi:hypothetical protein